MKEYFHLDLFAESSGMPDGLMLAAEWWVEFDYEPADPTVGMGETIHLNEISTDDLNGPAKKSLETWLAGQEAQVEELVWERILIEKQRKRDYEEAARVDAYEDKILRRVYGL